MPQRRDSAGTECNAVMGMLFLGARAPLDLLNVKVKVKTSKKFLNIRSLPDLSEVLKKLLGIVRVIVDEVIEVDELDKGNISAALGEQEK